MHRDHTSSEEWAPYPAWPGVEVSTSGRVRRHGKAKELPVTEEGYRRAMVKIGGVVHNRLVHRMVLEVFVGVCPPGMQCRHLDGDRENNVVGNLSWGTARSNWDDRRRHGTDSVGERNPSARLKEWEVLDIRARHGAGGVSQSRLAEDYGVTQSTISLVLLRKSWRHL